MWSIFNLVGSVFTRGATLSQPQCSIMSLLSQRPGFEKNSNYTRSAQVISLVGRTVHNLWSYSARLLSTQAWGRYSCWQLLEYWASLSLLCLGITFVFSSLTAIIKLLLELSVGGYYNNNGVWFLSIQFASRLQSRRQRQYRSSGTRNWSLPMPCSPPCIQLLWCS